MAEYKRIYMDVHGVQYVKLPDISTCLGCSADTDTHLCNDIISVNGKSCLDGEGVWVADTPEGKAAYVIARMEHRP